MYQQVYDPVAHSLGLTSIFAAIPLTLMFVMLGVFKRSPQLSALVSLLATLAVATLVYPMPLAAALDSGLFGVAFAILTIAWILVNAMWIYNMTVETGHFQILRESFSHISEDLRIQAIIIAFCFGALIEALAGSGVPIAICSAMLVAIGFDPDQGGSRVAGRQYRAGRLWGARGPDHHPQQDDGPALRRARRDGRPTMPGHRSRRAFRPRAHRRRRPRLARDLARGAGGRASRSPSLSSSSPISSPYPCRTSSPASPRRRPSWR